MSQNSAPETVQLFKKVYGDGTDLVPEDYILAKDIPFSEKQKTGDKYVEAVILTNETGITFMGSGFEAGEINPAIAGAVKQVEVQPYASILPSVVPFAVISRSAGGGAKAFFEATKFIVKNNLKSHGKFQEIVRLYGQSTDLLGYVSYATATYRGVALTNGTGTINGVAFTNGINAADKAILFSPGQFASGIWVGMEGVIVQQVNASGVVVAEGKLLGVESEYGYIYVDFTPIAASSTVSHRLCFKGMAEGKEYMGIKKILTTSGSLFGVNNSQYALWRGNYKILSNVKMTFERAQQGIAAAVNLGGLDNDITMYVNPRTWGNIVTDQSAARRTDSSYSPGEIDNGSETITFYSQNGKLMIKAHRLMKEGDAAGLSLGDWSRSGSAEVSFKVPGMDKEVIFPLENMTAYAFRSYSDQYIFCHGPAKSIWWSGINDEAAS